MPNYQIQPHTTSATAFKTTNILMLHAPAFREDLKVNKDEYDEVYKNIIRKYKRRNRNGKLLTKDPMEFNKLTE